MSRICKDTPLKQKTTKGENVCDRAMQCKLNLALLKGLKSMEKHSLISNAPGVWRNTANNLSLRHHCTSVRSSYSSWKGLFPIVLAFRMVLFSTLVSHLTSLHMWMQTRGPSVLNVPYNAIDFHLSSWLFIN